MYEGDFVSEILVKELERRDKFCTKSFLYKDFIASLDFQILTECIKIYNNNHSLIARKLGISRGTLRKKLKFLNLL